MATRFVSLLTALDRNRLLSVARTRLEDPDVDAWSSKADIVRELVRYEPRGLFEQFPIGELRTMLAAAGLSLQGAKQDLVDRAATHVAHDPSVGPFRDLLRMLTKALLADLAHRSGCWEPGYSTLLKEHLVDRLAEASPAELLRHLLVPELRTLCQLAGVPSGGAKPVVIDRLLDHLGVLDQVSVPAASGPKRALLIGNQDYRTESKLNNPVRDVRSVGAALASIGFQVTTVCDADLDGMRAAIRAHVTALSPHSLSLFYFSGHGLEIERENLALPIDFDADTARQALKLGLSVQQFLDDVEERKPRASITILDACRTNAFGRTRSSSRGLHPLVAGRGEMIAFAAAPRKVAYDGEPGTNGTFTASLLNHLTTPTLHVDDLFFRVRCEVARDSGGDQIPYTSSGIFEPVYLAR